MKPMTVEFICLCLRDCPELNFIAGTEYTGRLSFRKSGECIFIIKYPSKSEMACTQEWFAEFFELTNVG